jgi:hypothetical protein
MEKQMMIVAATMCLHNFIRENHAEDKHFLKCDRNPDYLPTIYRRHRISQAVGDTSSAADDDRMMDRFREDLARAIYISRSCGLACIRQCNECIMPIFIIVN